METNRHFLLRRFSSVTLPFDEKKKMKSNLISQRKWIVDWNSKSRKIFFFLGACCLFFQACLVDENKKASEETGSISFQIVKNGNSTYPRPGKDTVALVNDLNQIDSIDINGYMDLRNAISGKIDFDKNSLVLFLTRALGSYADSANIDSIVAKNTGLSVHATVHIKDRGPSMMGCSYSAVSIKKRVLSDISIFVAENRIHIK